MVHLTTSFLHVTQNNKSNQPAKNLKPDGVYVCHAELMLWKCQLCSNDWSQIMLQGNPT